MGTALVIDDEEDEDDELTYEKVMSYFPLSAHHRTKIISCQCAWNKAMDNVLKPLATIYFFLLLALRVLHRMS